MTTDVMESQIQFLHELEADLLEAAERERAPAPTRVTRIRPGSTLRPTRRTVALLAAAFLAIAGVIGYLVTRGSGATAPSTRIQSLARTVAPSPRIAANDRSRLFLPFTGTRGAIEAPAGLPASSVPPSGPDGGVALVGPQIVKTAELSVIVPKDHFTGSFAAATAVAARYGGFVASSSTAGSPDRSGMIVLRVPAEKFDAALADLRGLGRLQSQDISGQDVTAHVVDLNARLRTWRSQEAALLRLMTKATTVAETLRVQGELQRVQLTIEELEGQLRVLADQTTNATITLSLAEAGAPKPHPESVTNPSISKGVRQGVAGFIGVLVAVVVGIGYLVPITLLALLAWWAVRRTRRRVLA